MRLFGCDSLSGGLSPLKSINPLDCIGDGSNQAISIGDRAVVANASGKVAFYILKEIAGQVDTGIMIVIPQTNPADFVWICCGFTDNSLFALPGHTYQLTESSVIPPKGFIGGSIPYSKLSLHVWDFPYDSSEWNWYASAIKDNKLYVVYASDLMSWDIETGAYLSEVIDNLEEMYYIPGHCTIDTDGSENLITDFSGDDLTLKRVSISQKIGTHIPFVFGGGLTSWSDALGNGGNIPYIGVRVGNTHYGWSGDTSYPSLKGVKVNVLTGSVTPIADSNIQVIWGMLVPNLYTREIYVLNDAGDTTLQKYDPVIDTWESLAIFTGYIEGIWIGWFDIVTNSLIVPSLDGTTHIYDVLTNTWSVHYTFDGSSCYTGCCLFYKDLGAVWPFSFYEDVSLRHGIINSKNPYGITKI